MTAGPDTPLHWADAAAEAAIASGRPAVVSSGISPSEPGVRLREQHMAERQP